MLPEKTKTSQRSNGYYKIYLKENSLRNVFLEFNFGSGSRPDALLSSFNSNFACELLYWYTLHRFIK